MTNFTEELEKLWEQMRVAIINKVEAIGVDSEVVGFKTIQLNLNEFYCDADLNHGGVLTEIGVDCIFDNDGYSYQYGVLTHEQLAELVDYINGLK